MDAGPVASSTCRAHQADLARPSFPIEAIVSTRDTREGYGTRGGQGNVGRPRPGRGGGGGRKGR